MKKTIYIFTTVLIFITGFSAPLFSGSPDAGHQNNEHMQQMKTEASMNHSGNMGKMIHQSSVEGYGFMYHLITMPEQAKGMAEMENTHHLMVFISAPDGKTIDTGTIGYLIKGPDGKIQQKMTMAMSGGFGADINLKGKGSFAIKTKAVVKERTLVDDFTYMAE